MDILEIPQTIKSSLQPPWLADLSLFPMVKKSHCMNVKNYKSLWSVLTPHINHKAVMKRGTLFKTRICVLDKLLQPGISRGPSLHLLRHRWPLHLFLQHLSLLQGVPDHKDATLPLRSPHWGRLGFQLDLKWSWPAVLAPPQHSAVGTTTIASSWLQQLASSFFFPIAQQNKRVSRLFVFMHGCLHDFQ